VANEEDNQLARGEMEVGGQHLSLQDVKSDAYVVGAVNDHIVPWQASYKAIRLLGGNVRYVLSNGGHVAGIVNPPVPKARHGVAGQKRPTAAEWRASAESRSGSRWERLDQMGREAGRCLTAPPPLGSRRRPGARRGPGDYIHG
jgi:poly[(R)-3-hydroxyalkanoate] polymerase subunit PhaC